MEDNIWPSIVAKNQVELNALLKKLRGVSKILHLDIVDGNFAPNYSLDFNFKLSHNFNYVAHLMIKHPEEWIKRYGAKVKWYIPHLEALSDIKAYIKSQKDLKKKVSLAILPETKIKIIKPFLLDIDYLLILTVHPGFYGSKYLIRNWKIKRIKRLNHSMKIIVDGGMNPKTIVAAKKAGADYFISGSYISKADNPKERMKELKQSLV
ncbi:hypothetical protein HYT52_03280 [Candidatus Woesearchaeota archaeon]|nr:hypothetical protein [Candidatus Woesearchaeota archaeon]